MSIEYSEVDVTPELAETWLARSAVNRRPRPRKVAEYARDMVAGHWLLTAEPIKFNSADQMIDGQHRCRAIVASGVTVRMTIARNVEDTTQRVMDSGASRTAADNLQIEGQPYPGVLATLARRLVALERSPHIHQAANEVTKSEVYEFIDNHPNIKEAVEIGARYARDRGALALPAATVGLAAYVIAETNGFEAAEQFFAAAVEKVGLAPGDPVLAMCAAFQLYAARRQHLPAQAQLSLIVRCFNARSAGETWERARVKSPKGGWVPVPKVTKIAADEHRAPSEDA
jgi:hypothetical protein